MNSLPVLGKGAIGCTVDFSRKSQPPALAGGVFTLCSNLQIGPAFTLSGHDLF